MDHLSVTDAGLDTGRWGRNEKCKVLELEA